PRPRPRRRLRCAPLRTASRGRRRRHANLPPRQPPRRRPGGERGRGDLALHPQCSRLRPSTSPRHTGSRRPGRLRVLATQPAGHPRRRMAAAASDAHRDRRSRRLAQRRNPIPNTERSSSLMKARKHTRHLETKAPDGTTITVPLATITGSRDGPRLAIVGGVHGAEYAGIEAVRRVIGMLDPDTLSGEVAAVPCLNLPAFYGFAAHVNPIDGENPARVFPGSEDGSYTERMVDLAWRNALAAADYIVDVHGGDIEEELVDYSQINLNGDANHDAAAEALALALDMPFFVRRAAPKEPVTSCGTICQVASAHGIPAALAEAGSHAELEETSVEAHVKGLRNVLYHLEMLPGTPSI